MKGCKTKGCPARHCARWLTVGDKEYTFTVGVGDPDMYVLVNREYVGFKCDGYVLGAVG